MLSIVDEKYIMDDSLLPYRGYEAAIGQVMQDAVSDHSDEHDSFGVQEHNSVANPYQRADCVGVLGQAADYKTMQQLTPLIFPDFENVVDRLVDTRDDMLSAAAGALENGHDVTSIADHRQVIGGAVTGCAFIAGLYVSGHIDHGDIDTEIAVSDMLKWTQIHGMPGMDVLSSVFTVTRTVSPANNHSNRAKMPKGYPQDKNTATLQARHEHTGKPKVTIVMPSATRDIFLKGRRFGKNRHTEGYHMGPPTNGTVQEYMVDKYVLATGADLSLGAEGIYFGKLLRNTQTKSAVEAYGLMQQIADAMTEITGTRSIFVPDMEKFKAIREIYKEQRRGLHMKKPVETK